MRPFSTAAAAGGRTSCRTSQNFAAIGALLYDAVTTKDDLRSIFTPKTARIGRANIRREQQYTNSEQNRKNWQNTSI